MSNQEKYRTIVKSSAIFGGTQVFNILINLVRGKLIALFLGPAGMGISALFTTTSNMINQFTNLGVNMTAVKDISKESANNDRQQLLQLIYNFRILLLILGLFGALISFLFAGTLSYQAFGNSSYQVHFKFLAIFMFLTTLSSGELAILQGRRKLKQLAIGNVSSSILALSTGIPLYYHLGVDGIVPAMIVLALFNFVVYLYFNRDTFNFQLIKFQSNLFFQASKKMIYLGVVLMVATLLGTLSTYLLNLYISNRGSIEDLGFFQAANSITNQYVSLVFAAMAIDYFPRLSAIVDSKIELNKLVNEQFEIVLLIVAPIVSIIFVIAPWIVHLLLTKDFLVIVPLLSIMSFGVFFKAASYPLGYISFAKGDRKIYFWLEGIFGNAMMLILNITSYHFFGLLGLSISFLSFFVLYLFVVYAVVYKRYSFVFSRNSLILLSVLVVLLFSNLVIVRYIDSLIIKYTLSTILTILVSAYSIKELNNRIGIVDLIQKKFKS